MFLNLLFDLSTSNGFTFHFSPGPSSWRCEWPRPRADPKSPARLARTRTCVRVWKACAAEAKAAPGVALHQAPRSDGRWDLARPAQDLRLGLCGTKSHRRIYLPFLFPSAFFFPPWPPFTEETRNRHPPAPNLLRARKRGRFPPSIVPRSVKGP